MLCAECRTENPDGLKFCNECGAAFKTPCASCGFENASAAKFCGQCGAGLRSYPTAAAKKANDRQIRVADAPASEKIDGERKTVTALFADIKGSTELMEDLDPEEARAIKDLMTVEVKEKSLTIEDIYQAKMYKEVFARSRCGQSRSARE